MRLTREIGKPGGIIGGPKLLYGYAAFRLYAFYVAWALQVHLFIQSFSNKEVKTWMTERKR